MGDGTAMSLFLSIFFGCAGMGYFLYGKRERKIVAMICGIGLMLFTWFVSSTLGELVIGSALMAAPFYFNV